jgi:hypothetical protein
LLAILSSMAHTEEDRSGRLLFVATWLAVRVSRPRRRRWTTPARTHLRASRMWSGTVRRPQRTRTRRLGSGCSHGWGVRFTLRPWCVRGRPCAPLLRPGRWARCSGRGEHDVGAAHHQRRAQRCSPGTLTTASGAAGEEAGGGGRRGAGGGQEARWRVAVWGTEEDELGRK